MTKSPETTPAQAFGHVLRELRKAKNLSQENLAFDAELERNFISLLERSQQTPSLNTVFKLSKAFGIKPSELVAQVEVLCGA
jgi:transcriptional regulator with XRE-family HTH domain